MADLNRARTAAALGKGGNHHQRRKPL